MAKDGNRAKFDRWVDIASVVLISVATVATAWCGYEAARWTGVQTQQYSQASGYRISASESSARANTLTTIDVAMFLRYATTVAEQRARETAFLYKRFRPEMKRALDAWLATKPLTNPNAPSSPFAMPAYQLAARAQEDTLKRQAAASFAAAESANERADEYVRLTVIFAAVSFLAGISTRFIYPSHVIVVGVGFAMFFFGFIRVVTSPLH